MDPYQQGKNAKKDSINPYEIKVGDIFRDREDRLQQRVDFRRWQAGYYGEDDPYPYGWAT